MCSASPDASMMGGRKSRRHSRKAGRRTARRHHKKGGMFGALSGIVQTALVPFGLYGAQKLMQRSGKRHHK